MRKFLLGLCWTFGWFHTNIEYFCTPVDAKIIGWENNIHAYNILIGVPIGAIVSAIMYENNNSAALTQIVGLIMFGLLIIGFSKAFKTLTYYSDGHFKDRYLLEALNELEYAED